MRVVSMINYKGGVGKTTLTLNLAAQMASAHGQRILLIDLDPQASLTFSCVPYDTWRDDLAETRTIKQWYESIVYQGTITPLGDLIYELQRLRFNPGRVDLVSSHLGLVDIDLELTVDAAGVTQSQLANNFVRTHSLLKDALSAIRDERDYDLVMIDCPPNFGIVTRSAIIASDGYFIPTKPEHLSTLGIDQLLRNIVALIGGYNTYMTQSVRNDPNISPVNCGVIFNMCKEYRHVIEAQRGFIARVQNLRINNVIIDVLDEKPKHNSSLYSRQILDGRPLVLQNELLTPEPMFADIQASLQALALEVYDIIQRL